MPDTSSSTSSDRRGQLVCAFGLIVQLCVFGGIFALGWLQGSDAIASEAIHLAGGALIWLCLLVVFSQRKRANAEAFETDELRRAAEAGASTAIFEAADETLHLERHRLRWMYRWFLPGFAVLLAIIHIGIYVAWHVQFAVPLDDETWGRAANPSLAAVVMAFVGFLCFLFSRYAAGMARQPEWRMLRAAATYLTGNAVACFLVVVALGLELLQVSLAEPLAVYVIRVTMLVLGIEFAINFVMDLYRPRSPDEEPRPGFDSRLLALVSEPGGIARSIADAINYQFGFEVSATWFYQLLQRSFLPLLVFTMAALVALSSVVIVDADQEAVVEHFGKLRDSRPLKPGIHLKWPWPVDRVYRHSVLRVRPLMVGSYAEEEAEKERVSTGKEVILWTEKHEFSPHMMVLVATPEETDLAISRAREPEGTAGRGRAAGVSMLMCSVAIQYQVTSLTDYLYNYQDPEAVMEAVAYQALTDYASSVDIETVVGPGREEFEEGLNAEIERKIADLELPLGIEVVFVGLQGAHPPSEDEVAKKFQDVVAAEKRKDAAIETARGKAELTKTNAAGSVERAGELVDAIVAMDRLESDPASSEEARLAAQQKVNELLMGDLAKGIRPMSGQAAAGIADARASRAALLSEARSKQRIFAYEQAAFEAAPELYRMRKYLDVLTKSVERIRKFVIVADPETTDLVIQIETEKPGLLDLAEPGEGK